MEEGVASIAERQQSRPRARRRIVWHCSICTRRVPSEAISVTEPEGAPEPRSSWVLCQTCYRALLEEMRRSPIRSPLRLRIAIGLVAAERWPRPRSQPSTRVSYFIDDHKLIPWIGWSFVIAMILHLFIVVALALFAH
ncbi:MAG: hypothetical protein ABI456_24465 [Ktedonobacteraceae bacterium]|nr:hypothetical protein [Chloroflexota bacterium]